MKVYCAFRSYCDDNDELFAIFFERDDAVNKLIDFAICDGYVDNTNENEVREHLDDRSCVLFSKDGTIVDVFEPFTMGYVVEEWEVE